MSKRRAKLIIWLLLFALGAIAAWSAVAGISNVLAYFQRGADPASALNIVPNVPPDLQVKLSWDADDADTGRSIDPFTRGQIEATYLRAWLQWNLSYLKGEPYGLKTYFTGPALSAAGDAVRDAAARQVRVEQVDAEHQLQLHFYSANGAIVSFTDHDALVAQVIRDSSGAAIYAGETRADYDVVMLLEDGNWQVRHWLRREAENRPTAAAAPCQGCAAVTHVAGSSILTRDGKTVGIAGVDYYPRATPWDAFWSAYDPAIVDRDFSRIKGLGLNTVRVFVPYAQFGGPKVLPAMRARLLDLLDRARAQQIQVIVTLFDFRADYDLLHWPDADRHLETLLTAFADHPAILAWDLKNEPDLDYRRAGQPVVDAWLAHVARLARGYDPHHLLTIGWSSPAAARGLVDLVDVVQFHYYAPAAELHSAYAALRAAAPGKPIVLGEFGLPTWNSVFPNGHTEGEQAAYYADVIGALRETDSAGYLAWTLYDFPNVPAGVAGRWPWQSGPQAHMGLLRADESAKPAAALLAPGVRLNVARAPSWTRFLKPFWLAALALALAGAFAAARWARRHVRARGGGAPDFPVRRPKRWRWSRSKRRSTAEACLDAEPRMLHGEPSLGIPGEGQKTEDELTPPVAPRLPPAQEEVAGVPAARPIEVERADSTLPDLVAPDISEPAIVRVPAAHTARILGEPGARMDLIGPNDLFEGRYHSARGVHVLGRARGVIVSRRYICVERGGWAEADLVAPDITVAGEVRGGVVCRRLEVTRTGRIAGRVRVALLIVHEGAIVDAEMTSRDR